MSILNLTISTFDYAEEDMAFEIMEKKPGTFEKAEGVFTKMARMFSQDFVGLPDGVQVVIGKTEEELGSPVLVKKHNKTGKFHIFHDVGQDVAGCYVRDFRSIILCKLNPWVMAHESEHAWQHTVCNKLGIITGSFVHALGEIFAYVKTDPEGKVAFTRVLGSLDVMRDQMAIGLITMAIMQKYPKLNPHHVKMGFSEWAEIALEAAGVADRIFQVEMENAPDYEEEWSHPEW